MCEDNEWGEQKKYRYIIDQHTKPNIAWFASAELPARPSLLTTGGQFVRLVLVSFSISPARYFPSQAIPFMSNVFGNRGNIASCFSISISAISIVVGCTLKVPVPNNYVGLEQTPTRFSETSDNAKTNQNSTRTLLRVFEARPLYRQSYPSDIYTRPKGTSS